MASDHLVFIDSLIAKNSHASPILYKLDFMENLCANSSPVSAQNVAYWMQFFRFFKNRLVSSGSPLFRFDMFLYLLSILNKLRGV